MTIDEGSRIRLPRWILEGVVLLSVAGITFTATHFVDNATWKVNVEDRLTNLEKIMILVQAEQRVNSDYRVKSQVQLDGILQMVQTNNQLLQEHERETRVRK